MCTHGTPPEACSAGRILLALIGHRASVGGSVSHDDWSRVIGAVDTSPGGVWIDYIRQAEYCTMDADGFSAVRQSCGCHVRG